MKEIQPDLVTFSLSRAYVWILLHSPCSWFLWRGAVPDVGFCIAISFELTLWLQCLYPLGIKRREKSSFIFSTSFPFLHHFSVLWMKGPPRTKPAIFSNSFVVEDTSNKESMGWKLLIQIFLKFSKNILHESNLCSLTQDTIWVYWTKF